ncbi:hypothetical protein PHJA_001694100 [Phtheirospermum japonicum]|uniref:Uncharacterized protein n=1 Tax=Phtheirospermum japonicum TaxID=374723 RepID=A0A830CEL9_9LAMI|nr:hypothetical protein PHJA_001694100 [Phtheirospermum japonicum]
MLEVFLTVAFSAPPLTLYFPPIRNLNLFLRIADYFIQDAVSYVGGVYPHLRLAISRLIFPASPPSEGRMLPVLFF